MKTDKKKILGLAVTTVMAAASTVVSDWMTNRQIDKKVSEAITKLLQE